MDQIRGALAMIVAGGIVLVAAGFFGAAHPAFDSIGAFRLQAISAFGVAFALALAFGALTARALALVGAFIAGAGVLPTALPAIEVPDADIVGYHHNLRFDNGRLDQLAAAIRASGADFVMLQEVSQANRGLMDMLREDYPEQAFCPFAGVGGVAILVDGTLRGQPGCAPGQGMMWARLRLRGGREVTLVNLHLAWPWPHGQAAHVDTVTGLLADLEGPLLIGGDFNMAPWGHTIDRIEEASGTELVRGLRLTLHKREFWPGLPIDHVLVSPELATDVTLGARTGSDHAALISRTRVP